VEGDRNCIDIKLHYNALTAAGLYACSEAPLLFYATCPIA